MNHLLPDAIKNNDTSDDWSFSLYFIAECVRQSEKPLSLNRAALLLMAFDVEMITQSGSIPRPFDRIKMKDDQYELWSLNQFLHGNWEAFNRLMTINHRSLTLNQKNLWMLESVDYSDRMALLGSTSKFTDRIMNDNLSHWLVMSDQDLKGKVRNFYGDVGSHWQSYGDLIPAMPGPDNILREHLKESWSDRVAINAAFGNL
jgi:hypothetical protein